MKTDRIEQASVRGIFAFVICIINKKKIDKIRIESARVRGSNKD